MSDKGQRGITGVVNGDFADVHDYLAADREGWWLDHGEIRANPRDSMFPDLFDGNDDKAVRFVARLAEEGSDLHVRAWAVHLLNRLTT
jgi:hypothetical protein